MAVVKVIGNSCAVPDGTLTLNNETLKAYLFQKINGSGLTKKTIIIRIISRPQPEGYVYNPDDDKVLDYQNLKDRVEAVVTAAENGEYDGADGQDGRDGTNGQDGADGEDGASAYEIAVDNGFVGTEQQWLASLKGETGATGAKGDKGDPGEIPMHTYSTTEQVVGTWIDGKPLYEKTLFFNNVTLTNSNNTSELVHNIDTIDNCFLVNSWYQYQAFSNDWRDTHLIRGSSDWYRAAFCCGSRAVFAEGLSTTFDPLSSRSYVVVIRYTKTID